jgi:hypothetical protein
VRRLTLGRSVTTATWVVSLSLSACSSSVNGAPNGSIPDSGTLVDAAVADAMADVSAHLVRLQSDLCSTPLPAGTGTTADCRVLLEGVGGDCASGGLGSPSAADLAVLEAAEQARDASLPAGMVCLLDQQAASTATVGVCADQATPAWCYVHGSCAPSDASVPCAQDLCTTPAFAEGGTAYAFAWLLCGD